MSIRIFSDKQEHPEDKPFKDGYGYSGFIHEFAVGRVVATGERNYHDDSDFYAIYMNDDGVPVTSEYATTRAWTYNNHANVDATPEVFQAYKDYLARQARTSTIRKRLQLRQNIRAVSKESGIPVVHLRRLAKVYDGMTISVAGWGMYQPRHDTPVLPIIFTLLTKAAKGKLRSNFKKQLAFQLKTWAADDSPKFSRPLSPKQYQCLTW